MSVNIKKIALSEHAELPEEQLTVDKNLNFIANLEVQCVVRLGTLTLTIAELHQLKQGQTLELAQKTYEPVDLLLNNQIIARGDLMSCEEHFAIQITEICG